MFIPLHDANRLQHIKLQYVTIGLIALNTLVYFATTLGGEDFSNAAVLRPRLSSRPSSMTPWTCRRRSDRRSRELDLPDLFLPARATSSTSAATCCFCGCSATMSRTRSAISGSCSSTCFARSPAPSSTVWSRRTREVPLIGASGAIAGVVAAYLILHPRVKIWILAFGRIPLRIPAYIPLHPVDPVPDRDVRGRRRGQVSWACHIGGIIAGAVLVLVLRSREVPLLAGADGDAARRDQTRVSAEPVAGDPPLAQPPPRWGRGAFPVRIQPI